MSNAVTVGAIIVLAILLVVSFVVTNSHLANALVFVGGAMVVTVARSAWSFEALAPGAASRA